MSSSRRSTFSEDSDDNQKDVEREDNDLSQTLTKASKQLAGEAEPKDSVIIEIDEEENKKKQTPTLEEYLLAQSNKLFLKPTLFSGSLMDDPLFSLEEPIKDSKGEPSTNCTSCSKELNKKNKAKCSFCGLTYCVDCARQTKSFPKTPSKRYTICEPCSTKFFLKQLFEENIGNFTSASQKLDALKAERRQIAEEYIAIKGSYKEKKAQYKAERKKQKRILEELDLKLSQNKREDAVLMETQGQLYKEMQESPNLQRDIEEKVSEAETKLNAMIAERDKLKSDIAISQEQQKSLQEDLVKISDEIIKEEEKKKRGITNSFIDQAENAQKPLVPEMHDQEEKKGCCCLL